MVCGSVSGVPSWRVSANSAWIDSTRGVVLELEVWRARREPQWGQASGWPSVSPARWNPWAPVGPSDSGSRFNSAAARSSAAGSAVSPRFRSNRTDVMAVDGSVPSLLPAAQSGEIRLVPSAATYRRIRLVPSAATCNWISGRWNSERLASPCRRSHQPPRLRGVRRPRFGGFGRCVSRTRASGPTEPAPPASSRKSRRICDFAARAVPGSVTNWAR